ncbi:MAG: hypothetical protein P9L95_05475 [Candidatus Tenebribacter mawsonii]|nr:hypothetical protein [Candidatus Tenebribacter mawsonii]
MIGFDRPIKPRWIYELLNLVEDGVNSTTYNIPFEEIASELIGKEGKRKARTVIFRSFIYSLQDKKGTVRNNRIIELSKSKSLEYMTPIYLMKLIFDYEIIQNLLNFINSIYNTDQTIATSILTKKIVQVYGDRDISKRSLRAFLKTLSHFNILIPQSKNNEFDLNNSKVISEDQLKDILLLFGHSFLNTKHIDLQHIDKNLFSLYCFPNFLEVARKFNGISWEFIRAKNRNSLLLK